MMTEEKIASLFPFLILLLRSNETSRTDYEEKNWRCGAVRSRTKERQPCYLTAD
jgi:hypothetical protein